MNLMNKQKKSNSVKAKSTKVSKDLKEPVVNKEPVKTQSMVSILKGCELQFTVEPDNKYLKWLSGVITKNNIPPLISTDTVFSNPDLSVIITKAVCMDFTEDMGKLEDVDSVESSKSKGIEVEIL